MSRLAALHNLGCKVNAYETEVMQQLLEQSGYTIVPFEEYADVYLINTCTVTNIADRKSRQMLHKAKKQNPDAIVVAAGCYVQARGEEVLEDDAVDMILGNNQKTELVDRLEALFAAKEGKEDFPSQETECRPEGIQDLTKAAEYEPMEITGTAEHTRAFLKIQDGCNQFCSYCIIPYARGRIRSRKEEDVIKEISGLAKAGYREVVLTGIHLSSYGLDVPGAKKPPEEPFGHGLLDLILRVAEIPGIRRIRLGSLEPRIITEEFAKALASCEKICPHFHLSLQSGSTTVLKRMNRHYTAEEYLEKCEILRRFFSHPAITTDVIVGFPGETEEEFQETKEMVQKAGFYEMHVFPYSRRQGTVADRMPDQIPEKVKKERSHVLLALSEQMSEAYRKALIGKEVDLLLEEPDEEGCMAGYTREYVRVSVKPECTGEGFVAGTEIHGKLTCLNNKYIIE